MQSTLVFDLDGTLVNSGEVTMRCFELALSPYGVRVDHSLLELIRARKPENLFEGLIDPREYEEAGTRLLAFATSLASETRPFDGIPELLEELSARGVRLAVWTGRDATSGEAILRANQLRSHFKIVTGSCGVTRNKPHPEGLHRISEALSVPVTSLVHVGDHDHDIQGAKEAGALAVGSRWHSSAQRAWKVTPDHEFADLPSFREWALARWMHPARS
ncbi:MAG: HAD family hydrolase [Bdellovibrionota bacterium]